MLPTFSINPQHWCRWKIQILAVTTNDKNEPNTSMSSIIKTKFLTQMEHIRQNFDGYYPHRRNLKGFMQGGVEGGKTRNSYVKVSKCLYIYKREKKEKREKPQNLRTSRTHFLLNQSQQLEGSSVSEKEKRKNQTKHELKRIKKRSTRYILNFGERTSTVSLFSS